MSSSDAASRAGNSAIDRFGLVEDRAAADEIAARFDRLALDQIDRAAEELFERVLQIGETGEGVARRRLEGDEEIGVAAVAIEVAAAGRGAEDFQPRDAVAPAQLGEGLAFFGDVGLHVRLLDRKSTRL